MFKSDISYLDVL